MFNGYFVHALHCEFYRVMGYSASVPVITAAEAEDLHHFGFMYLMGPLHHKNF